MFYKDNVGGVVTFHCKVCSTDGTQHERKRGSSVVRHLALVLEVPGLFPARGEKNVGVRTRFLWRHLQG